MSNDFDPIDASEGQPEGQPEQSDQTQPEPQYAPTPRTYTEAEFNRHMGNARRSFEYEAAQRQEQAIAAAQAEWQQQAQAQFEQWYAAQTQQPQQAQQQDPNSPWARFDPTVAGELQAGLAQAIAPYQQRQAVLAQQAEEARAAAKYGPDFQKNREAVIAFANANGITSWDVAYRAFKYADRAQIEREAVSAHLKRKAAQSAQTPSVEGRGGGAPSARQIPRNRDEMDEQAIDILRRANQS